MKIHPREENVRIARQNLMACLMGFREHLTDGEFLRVVSDVLSSEWQTHAKHMIREERHPDEPNKPGGLA